MPFFYPGPHGDDSSMVPLAGSFTSESNMKTNETAPTHPGISRMESGDHSSANEKPEPVVVVQATNQDPGSKSHDHSFENENEVHNTSAKSSSDSEFELLEAASNRSSETSQPEELGILSSDGEMIKSSEGEEDGMENQPGGNHEEEPMCG